MRRTTRAAAAILALWVAILVPATGSASGVGRAPSQATGIIAGVVVDATARATLPGGLSVTATEVDAGATKQVATRRAAVGPGGAFRLDGFPGQTGDRYVVGTDYKGVTYSTEATPGTTATLKVYETTEDSSVLTIPSATLTVLIGKSGNYNVLQVFTVHNGADRSYVGTAPAVPGPAPTLELPIPGGATAFEVVQGLTAGLTAAPDGLVASTDPVQPGDTDVSYLYNVAVPRSGWGMNLPVVYPTAKEEVLVDPGLRLAGTGLTFRKSVTIGKQSYRDYEVTHLAPSTTLQANIAPSNSTSVTLYLGLGALAVLILASAFGVPRLLTRRREAPGPAGTAEVPAELPGEIPVGSAPIDGPPGRRQLVEEIAALDEAHAAGAVEEEAYVAQRADLKRRLVALSAGHSTGP